MPARLESFQNCSHWLAFENFHLGSTLALEEVDWSAFQVTDSLQHPNEAVF